ncbi:MAG TPA: RNA-binding protein, partial [Methanomassiliicoccaceae archaeon]|nr:RNA-binding protein [Methanomassiliicoccaceae archaeon]
MSEDVISQIKKGHIHKLLSMGRRMDGRAADEYRPIIVETGIIESAQGSARVKVGGTDVVVGVKMDIGSPFADTPDRGVLTT